jgi:hypothetical protein
MNGKIVRRREGKGKVIRLSVSALTKEKWEVIGKALAAQGYEIDTDQAVKRIIRNLEGVLKEGCK